MRAMTPTEKTNIRKSPSWVKLRLAAMENAPVVFACQVNQTTFGASTSKPYDQIAQVTFDNVTTGAYTDVLPGMTIFVGSVAGAYDKGILRARKSATSSVLYFGETSDVPWADNLHITVIDEMLLWPKHVRISAHVPYVDYDVAYSDQHSNFDPSVIMGGDRVVDVTSYPVALSFDCSASLCIGSSISTKAWSATAGSLTGGTTNTPTLTINSYPSNGRIRIKCTLTAANGKSFSGYRYIYVYDATHRPHEDDFTLDSCQGDYADGGWSFDVTMLASAGITSIRDRAKVILYGEFVHGTTTSDRLVLGQVPGCENVVAFGYIDGESIKYNSENSIVSFSVKGPNYWLDKMQGFPPGTEIKKNSMAAAWTNIPSLTVDKALFHLLHWRSTATAVIDVSLTNDDRIASAFEVPTESLWAQIVEIAETSIFAHPCCNRVGQLFVEVDANLVPQANRTWPTVMAIDSQDWSGEVTFGREVTNKASLLDLSGVAVNSQGKGTPFFSLSPGHIFTHYGSVEVSDRLLLKDQSSSNQLAGLAFGKLNNAYSDIELEFRYPQRMADIAPRSFFGLTINAADTIRGISYAGNVIPRSIDEQFDADKGKMTSKVIFEAETFEQIAITGDKPQDTSIPPDGGGETPPPPPPPIDPGEVPAGGMPNGILATNAGVFYTTDFNTTSPSWFAMSNGITHPDITDAHKQVQWIGRCPSGLLVCAAIDGDGDCGIYCSPGPGGVWTMLAQSNRTDPDLYNLIVGVAIDTTKDERIMVLYTGAPFGLSKSWWTVYVMMGDRNGVSNTAYTVSNDKSQAINGLVHTGNGWARVWFKDFGAGPHVSHMTDGGQQITEAVTPTSMYQGGVGSAFGGSRAYFWQSTGLACRLFSTNGDAGDLTALGAGPLTYPNIYSSLCCSPDGTRLMGGNNDAIAQRSSDSGVTWGPIGTTGGMSIGYRCWQNGGDNLWWYAVTAQKVMITSDFGDTWSDRSGDLATVAPLCVPQYLAVWNG